MGKILELPVHIANQIKAGEIVERPVSVVKELVENAIDAHSSQIDVLIAEGGLSKIQVIDNGDGMLFEDTLIAFKRHATSKMTALIQHADVLSPDKMPIETLGFRGEALPSIASVAKVTMETATADSVGTFVAIEGGTVLEQRAGAARKGTSISVEQLFYNTPARLKFISSLQTEVAKVVDLMNRLALSHPHIAFSLTVDGNRLLKTNGSGNLQQTLAGVYTPSLAKKMVTFQKENRQFKVSGYTSLPEVTRARKQFISVFLNGRYIRNFLLMNAVVDGYRSKLMIGRFPITVVNIEADFRLVDVNAHPTKETVRISQEGDLIALIQEAIGEAMDRVDRVPSSLPKRFDRAASSRPASSKGEQTRLTFGGDTASFGEQALGQDAVLEAPGSDATSPLAAEKPDLALLEGTRLEEQVDALGPAENQDDGPEAILEDSLAQGQAGVREKLVEDEEVSYEASNKERDLLYAKEREGETEGASYVAEEAAVMEGSGHQGEAKEKPKNFPELHYFGQMHGTYLFAENETGLYIVDQHAAQERIKYEYFRVKIGQVDGALQELLMPIVLDYPLNDYLLIQDKMALLEDVGIHLQPFGQQTFLLSAHPTWIKEDIEGVVRDLIQMALEENKVDIAKYREDLAIMMSCKRSIKANHHLNELQARQLLKDLSYCENPFNCPHGRPVLIHLTNTDMEKMFKRIQDR